MWPWNQKDVAQEVAPSLQQFYSQNEPQHTHLTDTQRNTQIGKVLARQSEAYDHELEKHKLQENGRTVAAINCAELQQAVVECYRGWSFLRGNECSTEISRTTKCLDVQQKALKTLRYENCYSKNHCRQIKAAVDVLFTENFGRLGEGLDEPSSHVRFDADLDLLFSVIWK